jgi:peptide chain release factor subunit 1
MEVTDTAIISESDLMDLAGFSSSEAWVVSLYLNVDGAKFPSVVNYEQHLRRFLKRAARDLIDRKSDAPKSKKQSLKKDLDRIGDFVSGRWRRRGTRGLAIFSCADGGFWRVFELPVPVPSALLVGNEAYTKTLTGLLDEFDRYCVVTVDRRKARIFTVFLGGIEEHHGVFVDEWVPDQVKQGDRGAMRQSTSGRSMRSTKRIARHTEDHVLHHLKETAALTFEFFVEHSFDRLIIAGHHEFLPQFRQTLHPYLEARVAGEFTIEPDAPLTEILKKSLEVEVGVQQLEEERLVGTVREQNGPGGRGAIGLGPTIEALMRGQAHKLLLAEDYSVEGFVCYRDHYLSTGTGDCPICGDPFTGVDDIAEDMIQLAINQGVEIAHISHVADFMENERIAAVLRFGLPQQKAG